MRLSVAVLLALGAACAPNPKAPVSVMALLPNLAGKLGPKQSQLETIQSVTALQGTAVKFLGNASIVFDSTDPAQANLASLSDDQLQDALYRSRGQGVDANLIDKGGVLWPADFHSWNMVSAYWNFEQAFLYFQRIYDGEKTDTLAGAPVLYWCGYRYADLAPERQDVVDNMFYDSRVRAFVAVPFRDQQKVPLVMNTGIVGHEFAHRVFNQKAYGGAAQPAVLGRWANNGALNILKALDEGLADFHGYGVTCVAKDGPGCKSTFLALSFPEEAALPRDFSRSAETCMTPELRGAIDTLGNDFLDLGKYYELGTLIAASLYQASNKGGKVEIMEKALIRSYDDTSTQTPGFHQVLDAYLASPEKFTLERVTDIIATHISDPELKRLTCNEMWDRLDLHPSLDPQWACPNTSVQGTQCMHTP